VVAALVDGVYLFDLGSGHLDLIVNPEPDHPTNRLNDGKVGPDGAFWIGSMDDRRHKEPVAALYRVTPGGPAENKVSGLVVSNGLGWSADGRTMFHSDSRGLWIDRYTFDPSTGQMSERVRIARLRREDGRPDGAAVDVQDAYWSCGVSAGCINRFSRDGELLEKIPVPVPRPTMCCFGGSDMRTLFFTTAREGLSVVEHRAHPLAGGLFSMRVDVAGVPIGVFTQ
jgi:sugar lactone lactonase YvrE